MRSTRIKFLEMLKEKGGELEVKAISQTDKGYRALINITDSMNAKLQTYYESNEDNFILALREMEDRAIRELFNSEEDIPTEKTDQEIIEEESEAQEKVKKKLQKKTTKKIAKKKAKVVKEVKSKGIMFNRNNDEHKNIAIGILCDLFGDDWIGNEDKTTKIREFNDEIEGREVILNEDGSISESFKELYKNEFTGIL